MFFKRDTVHIKLKMLSFLFSINIVITYIFIFKTKSYKIYFKSGVVFHTKYMQIDIEYSMMWNTKNNNNFVFRTNNKIMDAIKIK